MRRSRLAIHAVAVLFLVSCQGACSGGENRPKASGGATAGAAPDSGQGIEFQVTVDFTGARALSGSFVDDDHGGDGTCAQYATTNNPVVGWLGPQPPAGRDVRVNGQTVSYGLMLRPDQFHGPGTYSGGVMSGLTVGPDTFMGKNSSLTIKADGSGSATFTDFQMISRGSGSESGTMHWTCSPATH
jgi:hypothetical protein